MDEAASRRFGFVISNIYNMHSHAQHGNEIPAAAKAWDHLKFAASIGEQATLHMLTHPGRILLCRGCPLPFLKF
jgi:hypothetical protein